jgi:hypothetical protein
MAHEQFFDLDPDQEGELLERIEAADKEPQYSPEEVHERVCRFLTELRILNAVSKT